MFKSLTSMLVGSDERDIKKLKPIIEQINLLESACESLTSENLRGKTEKFKDRLQSGENLDAILPEAFAVVREAAKRTLGQRHFDVQLMGGIVLHQGNIAEMKTGEGKTLVATLPAYLNSLTGQGVHIVTVNDYLARRDAQWMGDIYHSIGVSVGALQHEASYIYDPLVDKNKPGMERLRRVQRQEVYQADITYGTNNEFGFDYLRDNMMIDPSQRVQRQPYYAIVDEVDNILIDEARTPLIISGPAEQSAKDYQRAARLVPKFKQEEDYIIDEKHRTVSLTPDGITNLEKMLNVNNLYDPANFALVHYIENALKSHAIYQRDREYVVRDGEVIIVDEFTGRLMMGRRYSDGLHQSIEAKEGVPIQRETITYANITLQNYFRLYDRLAGMTGTAATEAEEFWKIYKLDVIGIPTNKPMIRQDYPDLVYRDEKAKLNAVVVEIEERHAKGQPVLVGTTDIDKSELLSGMLNRKNIPNEVLNAKHHEREATIISQAGYPGAVTVATNMAGRGTDIVLGGTPPDVELSQDTWNADHQKVIALGGLHIIGTERHDARRIDNQLRGRAGRQGDPGSTRFYVALDDELMRRFGGDRIRSVMDFVGFDDDVPIENKLISKSIESAQVKVEGHHFDLRKYLVEYDDVINTHRDRIYGDRNKVLAGVDAKANLLAMVEYEIQDILTHHLSDKTRDSWDTESVLRELGIILPPPQDLSDPQVMSQLTHEEIESRLVAHSITLYDEMEEKLSTEEMSDVEIQVMLRSIDVNWIQHLTTMENLRQGIGLHAYGQRDPLVMYKKEGHQLFQNLQARIQHDIVHSIYHAGLTHGSAYMPVKSKGSSKNKRGVAPVTTTISRQGITAEDGSKVGRNAPCPCGSSKKYKRCHGA